MGTGGGEAAGQRAPFDARRLTFLSPREVYLIDRLLSSVGDFGEVHLTVKNGKLRFVATKKSYDALRLRRGAEEV